MSVELSPGSEDEFFKRFMEKGASGLFSGKIPFDQSLLPKGINGRITNPYLLESEACQKCFAQKSLPFT
jgi:hypothetical protein